MIKGLLSAAILTAVLVLGTVPAYAQQQSTAPAQDNAAAWTCPMAQQARCRPMMCRGPMRCGMRGGMRPNCPVNFQTPPGESEVMN